jgi:hypothetical protein
LNSHGRGRRFSYNEDVDRSFLKWLALAAVPCILAAALLPASAQSAPAQLFNTGSAPVVRLQMRSGSLTVKTWDRPQVQISSTAFVQARHFGPQAVARALQGGSVSIMETTIRTPKGDLKLPPETFAIGAVTASPHDGVLIFAGDVGASVTLTIPNGTALLWTNVGRGTIAMSGYHGGPFVMRVRAGGIELSGVSGEGYAEVARGPIVVANSSMDRIRARTAIGNIIFENCTMRQIEVSSIRGSIAYDNGTFAPGVARFETEDGNIALGVASGGLQIGAHSSTGQVVPSFERGAAQVSGSATDTQAIVNGGGPVVTADATHGSVYLYNGSLRSRPRLQRQWHPGGLPVRARTCAGRRCPF